MSLTKEQILDHNPEKGTLSKISKIGKQAKAELGQAQPNYNWRLD